MTQLTGDGGALDVTRLPVRNSEALLERLDDPRTVAALLDLLDVLPTLAGTLQILNGFFVNSEHILDNVRDSVSDITALLTGAPENPTTQKLLKLGQQSVPLAAQLVDSGIVDKVTESGIVEKVADSGLLDSGLIENVVESGLVEKVVQTDVLGKLAESGLIEKLADPSFAALLDTLMKAVDKAEKDTAAAPAHKMGMLALNRALGDLDVSRGIDFALHILKELGAHLASSRS